MKFNPKAFRQFKMTPMPEPVKTSLLLEAEKERHERRLREIDERFETMIRRIDETAAANQEHFQAKMKIITEAESAALKTRKAPPPRPATFKDVPKHKWASPAGVPTKPKPKR